MGGEQSPTQHKNSNHLFNRDTPCRNCGRYGCIPGSMVADPLQNIFCSPNCGWSFYLRPYQHKTFRSDRKVSTGSHLHQDKALMDAAKRRASKEGRPSARKPPHPSRGSGKGFSKLPLDSHSQTGNALFDMTETSNWWLWNFHYDGVDIMSILRW